MPKSNAADRHLILRAALRAYPAADREGYGEELLEAALDLAATESTTVREAAGLIAGGVQARVSRLRFGLTAIDLGAGLQRLTMPLAAFAVMVWSIAAVVRMIGWTASGVRGATIGAVLLLLVCAFLALGVARRQRGVATSAAVLLLVQVGCSVVWRATQTASVTAAPVLQLHLGPWWFGPGLIWSFLPLLMLLVPACWVMEPPAPRVPDLRRPMRERALFRGAVLLAPAVLLGAVLEVAPQLIVDGLIATTELPGIAFLMLIVAALWAAVTDEGERDGRSVAGALFGLAAVPSVAYGAARIVVTPFRGMIEDRDVLIALGMGVSVVLVLLAMIFFAIVLAQVGLRIVDRRGGSPLAVGHALDFGDDQPAHIG